MGLVRITLVRSPIGFPKKLRDILRSLGLTKLNSSVVRDDVAVLRGMIRKVNHLVRVVPAEERE